MNDAVAVANSGSTAVVVVTEEFTSLAHTMAAERTDSGEIDAQDRDLESRGAGGRVRDGIARLVERLIVRPLRSWFGVAAPWVGGGLATLLLVLAVRWRGRRGPNGERPVPARVGEGRGTYAEALRLLARRGLNRRRDWTARETLARSRPFLPESARPPFERLTEAHETERYAGRHPDTAASRSDLALLRRSLRAARGELAAGEDPARAP